MKADEMRALLREHRVEYEEKPVQYGDQFRVFWR